MRVQLSKLLAKKLNTQKIKTKLVVKINKQVLKMAKKNSIDC